jgi:hypothetical protein
MRGNFPHGGFADAQLQGHRQGRAEGLREVNQTQGIAAETAEDKSDRDKTKNHTQSLAEGVVHNVL